MSNRGIIFNIQRFTIHDGPGVRTELFLKGCPLRCEWCGNPESFSPKIQLGVYSSKCIQKEKCGLCMDVCQVENALKFHEGRLVAIDKEKCTKCFKCSEVCPSVAIKTWGNELSVEECMKIIRKDQGYYERSGGGVTVSGGEPLLQSDFVVALFKACKEENIHTCIESTFYGEWHEIEKVLLYTDLVISDIKHMDTKMHYRYTKVPNERILENLKKIADAGHDLILRIPVIPNVNDDMNNMEATADFIRNELGNKVRTLQLLSFMRLGQEKYESLGIPYPMLNIDLNREAFQNKVQDIAKYMNSRGIHCQVGTKEKN